jgi:hypothetical protein
MKSADNQSISVTVPSAALAKRGRLDRVRMEEQKFSSGCFEGQRRVRFLEIRGAYYYGQIKMPGHTHRVQLQEEIQ